MAEVKDNLLQLDKVVGDLNKRLDENIDKIDRLAVVYNKFSKESANAPSQYVTVLNDTKKAVDSVTISSKKLEQQSIRESNARNALNKQREQSIAQLAKEQAKLEASNNLYNKVQAKMNALSMEYKNLATRKELGLSLTAKEEQKYTSLQGKIQTYDKTLKAVDATMGKYQRNVGNYAGAFNPLSNSINQLSREMPAFANSVQTGFMAISNNLPIFFDAMQQSIAQQKELQAQGQPTKNALQLLAGSFFTLGTALSVGVTLLTLFGPKIIEFISGSKAKKEAIKAEKKAIEEKNKAEAEALRTTANYSSEEISNSKRLFENAKNLSLSYKERKDAIVELRQRYPEYLKGLSDEQILAGKTAEAEQELNNALVKRGFALAAQQQLQENITKELELRIKNSENNLQVLKDEQEALKIGANEIVIYTDKKKQAEQQNAAVQRKSRKEQYNAYVQSVLALKDERQAILSIYNENAKYIGIVNESSDATKKNTKAKKEAEIYNVGTVKWLEQQISRLKELNDTLSTSSEEYQIGVGAIKFYEAWLERLTGTAKKAKDELDGVTLDLSNDSPMTDSEGDRIKKEGDDLRAWYKDFRGSFQDDFWQNSGFSKIQFIIDNWDKLKESGVDTALAISEAFQEAFNTIANASQANFDAEYSRLEQQKEVSLQFSGESAAAKEEIERQYETRKKEIQRREAEAQKRLAMFNIVTNTAQAIIATLARTPPPAGIPLAALIGAIGAVQLGIVAGQQIPQFWKGTDNAPEGLAWTQERGAEVITDSKGNIKTLGHNKGAELTYLNKGDKVYKSHTDYINKELSKNGIQPIGQSFSSVNVSSGLTADDLNAGIESLKRTILQKENISINIDKKGFKTAVNGKNYINNRLILKGRSV